MVNSLKKPGRLLFANWGMNLDEVPLDQLDHYIAVENYLTDDEEPPPDATNIETVKGYLEAFNHLCEVKEWKRASEIAVIRCDISPHQELHIQLKIWGYSREIIELYSRLLGKLSPEVDVIFRNSWGNVYYSLGKYQLAIDYHQQSLAIALEIGDLLIEGTAMGNLGNTYNSLGQYQQAIDYHQQCLAIARQIGHSEGEGAALSNLGNAYNSLGLYQQAIDYLQQSLVIVQEIGARLMEGTALVNLGNTYNFLGQYQQAIDYYQQSLAIVQENGARLGEGTTLGNLGNVYRSLGQYHRAIISRV